METTRNASAENLTPEQMESDIKHELVVMEDGSLSVIDQSMALEVTDLVSKNKSISLQNDAKSQIKRLTVLFKPFKAALKARHQNACDKEGERTKPLLEVVANEGVKCATWNQAEKERAEKIAAEIAAKEAQERAERLKAIQADITETIGTATDSQATIDILNMMLDNDNPSEEKAEILRSQIQTEQAVLDGANRQAAEEAAEAEREAAYVPPPPPPTAPPKSKNEVTGYKYEVEVTDIKALCQAIVDGNVAEAGIKIAQGKLNSYAKDGIIKNGMYGCSVTKTPTSFTR